MQRSEVAALQLLPLAASPPCGCSPLQFLPLAVAPLCNCAPLQVRPLASDPPCNCSLVGPAPPRSGSPMQPLPLAAATPCNNALVAAAPPCRCALSSGSGSAASRPRLFPKLEPSQGTSQTLSPPTPVSQKTDRRPRPPDPYGVNAYYGSTLYQEQGNMLQYCTGESTLFE